VLQKLPECVFRAVPSLQWKGRPKPDAVIYEMKDRKKINVWDFKAPSETGQLITEKKGKEYYETAAQELNENNGWKTVETHIQSVTATYQKTVTLNVKRSASETYRNGMDFHGKNM
jgi:hypothetical protein